MIRFIYRLQLYLFLKLFRQAMTFQVLLILCFVSYTTSAQVKMFVSPAQTDRVVGDVFSVEINVDAGMQSVDGANVFFSFDPAILQVQTATAGSSLNVSIVPLSYDNSSGEVEYAYGLLADSISGTFNLFTIEFKAIASGSGNLQFQIRNGIETDLSYSGASVLDVLENGQVNIAEPNTTPVIEAQSFTVEEGSATGTVVGTVVASDTDGDALTYSITAGNTGNAFAINGSTGELTVASSSALDISVNPEFVLTVEVSDGQAANSATITIKVNAVPEIAAQSFIVEEGSAAGTIVGTVAASDANGDALTYSITAGNTGGAFAIDGSTGELTVASSSALDISTTPEFILTVEVSDGTAAASGAITIKVNTAPEIEAQSFTVEEGSAAGTVVGTVAASDTNGDVLTYSITAGNTGNAFAINGSTGELTVASSSALDIATNSEFFLTVEVHDGTSGSTATITVTLIAANSAPVIEAQSFTVEEGSATGTVVGTVAASDTDGDDLTYSITAGNTGGAFAIDPVSGEITVSNSSELDFETTPVFSLTIQVNDEELTSSATVTVELQDVDENQAPVIENQGFTIAENSINGTIVGTVVATDPEGQPLNYSIIAGNTDNTFAINAVTGELSVADSSSLDFEITQTFTLTVEVSDGSLNASAEITINLTDVDDNITAIEGDISDYVVIFPNPAVDYVVVQSEIVIHDTDLLKLYDVKGRPVQFSVRKINSTSYRIYLKGLDSGVYLLWIQINGKPDVKKIIKKF